MLYRLEDGRKCEMGWVLEEGLGCSQGLLYCFEALDHSVSINLLILFDKFTRPLGHMLTQFLMHGLVLPKNHTVARIGH